MKNIELSKYYQPELTREEWERGLLSSFEVYPNEWQAKLDFPNHKIIEYNDGDIEKPTIVWSSKVVSIDEDSDTGCDLIINGAFLNFENEQELFDRLGDFDVVQANEIEQNYVACNSYVYEMDDVVIDKLHDGEKIVLDCLGTVDNIASDNFKNWYYGNL